MCYVVCLSSHLEVRQVGLLVKGCRLKSERVDNVVDGDCSILECFLLFFSRLVGSNVNVCSCLDGDQCTIYFVDYVINEFPLMEESKPLIDNLVPEAEGQSTNIGKASENISSPVRTSEYNNMAYRL